MIPLSTHSHYSLMRGTSSVTELCRRARQLGYTQVALTDTDNLYGLWPFLDACDQENITPIIGAEITDPHSEKRAICLVEDEVGYRNLCRLLTRRHCEESFDFRGAVADHAAGLLILTGDEGLLAFWHEHGAAVAAALPYRPGKIGRRVRQQAKRLAVPTAVVPASFFLDPADFRLHRLLRAIDGNTSLSRLSPREITCGDAWLASPATYQHRFAIWPEAARNTHAIAERCCFRGPRFGTVMPPHENKDGQAADAELRKAAYEGARRRYGDDLSEVVVERLEHELRIIGHMGFAAYFLVVWDIVRQTSRTCGRGSGAASLVSYSLGITNVCPLKNNLYFERFLNPGRTDPPDIDVDFAWDERDAILDRVLHRYGDRAAMVCNHVSFQPRMAIREVAKVYGLPDREISNVTRRLPWLWRGNLRETELLEKLQQVPNLKDFDFPQPWPEILASAQRLITTPRYLSVHPGGVVITPRPICEYVPVERAPKGVPIIQWEKDATEEAGLVKIDLLGNRSLGVIRDTLRNMRENKISFDEARWQPEDDEKTQAVVARGETMGCFYIESPAMRLLQQKAGIGDFEHLVVHSSIIRPAANEFIREYIRRLHGGAWQPLHPYLAEILEETFGIMVYQEDVSRVAVALAGFSHAQADGLRKVMSKKDRTRRLADYQQRFFAGARARGVAEEQTAAIWDMMMSFSGYSFCKPHSASYAQVSFQAAYLKVHYSAEFMAAVIGNQGGFYSTFAYVSEARRLGLIVLPPDVMESHSRWTGCGAFLRVGLMAISELCRETQERIIAQRKIQPYQTMTDFLHRVSPAETEARSLIHAGALDRLNPGTSRAALLWKLACWQKEKRDPAVMNLFGTAQETRLPTLPPENGMNRWRREFEALGFLVHRHPMELYADELKTAHIVKAAALPRFIGGKVWFAGWLITGKTVRTKHGEAMQFLTFEDETGLVETTFFPKTYKRYCHMLDTGRPFLLRGKVEEDYGAITLTVDEIQAITKHRRIAGARRKTSFFSGIKLR